MKENYPLPTHGFGIDQCPICGSKDVRHEARMKPGGGPNEINDHISVLMCDNCGRNGGK